jgi:SulP family sulfate permease
VIFGLLRAGRLVRFVSHAVMTGFLAGVAALLILDQSAPFVGVTVEGRNEVAQFFDLLTRPSDFSVTTMAAGVLALVLTVGLGRTTVGNLSSVIALVVPSALVAFFKWEDVQRVADVSPIPRGIPTLTLPDFALLTPELIMAAFAIAVVIGVQGAGVSQSVENPDDSPVNTSRDLAAQGLANVASGFLSGIPAGGSVGQTALNVSVGARTRWSGILGGAWMLVIVLAAGGLVGRVPMSVLAALMIMSGISALDFREARSIWNTGGSARLAIVVTFAATLFLSIPMAVGAGVLLTILVYLSSSASDVRVRALVPAGNGRVAAQSPPPRLESDAILVLDVYGSLFFAGARTLADSLPTPDGAERPAVVLRLRGRSSVGATLDRCPRRLRGLAGGNRRAAVSRWCERIGRHTASPLRQTRHRRCGAYRSGPRRVGPIGRRGTRPCRRVAARCPQRARRTLRPSKGSTSPDSFRIAAWRLRVLHARRATPGRRRPPPAWTPIRMEWLDVHASLRAAAACLSGRSADAPRH